MEIDLTKSEFVGRVRKQDGTFGLSSTMSMDELLKGLLDYLPIDIIYRTTMDEDGIITTEPIGRIGLSFKVGEIKKEQFHGEQQQQIEEGQHVGQQLRTGGDSEREENFNGSGRSGLDEGVQHGSDSKRVRRKRKQSSTKHNGRVEQGEAEGGDLDAQQLPLIPTPDAVEAVKADQKKRRGRPQGSKKAISANIDGDKAKKKFEGQFTFFGKPPGHQ